MVIRHRLALLVLFGASSLSSQAAVLQVHADATAMELGKPLQLVIQAKATAAGEVPDLAALDLSALRRDFEIVRRRQADATGHGTSGQQLELTLYPRRTGTLFIPALALREARSQPVRIRVRPGQARGQAIRLDSELSTTRPWQRQQVLLRITITTADAFASLHSEPPQLPGFETVLLPPHRQPVRVNGKPGARLAIGWALFPLQPGTQQLELPAILYRVGGVTQRRYYLPPLALQVRPLPPYLPPTIPVGRVRISSQVQPTRLIRPGHLGFWTINLEAPDLLPAWLPAVLRQLKDTDAIHYLPAKSRRRLTPAATGVNAEVSHVIPFKALRNGPLALPVLEVQVFDPERGRLLRIRHQPRPPWSLGLVWQGVLLVLGLAMLYWLGRHGYRAWSNYRQRRRLRLKALARLQQAATPQEICAALRLFGQMLGWPVNLSVSAWQARWQAQFMAPPELPHWLAQLAAACYGRAQQCDLPALRGQLHALLANPRSSQKPAEPGTAPDPWQPEAFSRLPPAGKTAPP